MECIGLFKQHKTSRDQKLTPYHEEMKKAGACFGVSGGYERPMWYATNGRNQSMNILIIIKTGIQLLSARLKILEKTLVCLILQHFLNMT